MAHPFAKHGEEHAGKERAKHFTKGYKRGGRARHGDEAEDRKLFGKMIKEHDMKPEGKASGGRLDKYARGGRTKSGHNTKINIVVAPRGPHPATGAAPPAPGAMPMPMPPPGGGPPPGLGAGPPGLPPGGPMGPKPPGMMARGGKVKMSGGAETGQGRLDKAKAYKARG